MAAAVLLVSFMASSGFGCVGRILTIAVDHNADQRVIGNMLAVLINERTGTTVNIRETGDVESCFAMVRDEQADLFISYTGTAMPDSKAVNGKSFDEAYALIKQFYKEKYRMIWLKPYLYHGPVEREGAEGLSSGTVSAAAPVTTVKVLDRFPILDRVINKLCDKVDDTVMKQLIDESGRRPVKEVVRDFLKSRHLI
jgi:glycine betaine/choline ABC-type transport system substrate-binding protein